MFIARRIPKSLKAPAGRHVYHASASSSDQTHILPVFRPSGATCVSCFGVIVRIKNILSRNVSFAPYSMPMCPTPALQRSAMCMMGGGLKFLAPAGRHVYRNVESLPIQALAGRHVYHVSAASSESKTYCRIYIEMLMPVFRPSGAACL